MGHSRIAVKEFVMCFVATVSEYVDYLVAETCDLWFQSSIVPNEDFDAHWCVLAALEDELVRVCH